MTALAIALACVISNACVQAFSESCFPGRIPFEPEIVPEILPHDADRLAKFFPPTDTEDGLQKLRMTSIGEFSMASPEVANRISEIILSYFPTNVSLTITDVNGNMGGSTLSFSRHFANVNTMEVLPLHCDVLKTNLVQFGCTTNVKVHCHDYLDLMDSLQQDIIYFDPPRIRDDYLSNKTSIELHLGSVNLVDIVNYVLSRAQLIAIRVPINFNIGGFVSKVKSDPIHIHELKFNDSQISESDSSSYLIILESPTRVPTQMQQFNDIGDYEKQDENANVNQTRQLNDIGDYEKQDDYAKVNGEVWYSKYGLVPSVIHYLAPRANGKVIKDFGCARGDVSMQVLEGTGASHLHGFTLFDAEVQGSEKLAEGKPATFTQHDCSVVKKFGQEAPVTYSLWMLNNAKTKDMFLGMLQTMLVNTEPGGVGFFLLHLAESVHFDDSNSKDFKILKVETFPTEERILGVLVEKLMWLGNDQVFMRDHCYPRKLVLKWIREAGWIDVEEVPTLPLSTDKFGDPKEAARYIDENHYSMFMARKPTRLGKSEESVSFSVN